jgi:hypothetical protein
MRRKWMPAVAAFVGLFLAYPCAQKVIVAKAVLPPSARSSQIIEGLLRPRYEMAAPHHSLLNEVRVAVVPVANACGTGTAQCDGTQAKATCNDACGFCGHCPDCLNGPCTIYTCQPVTNQKNLCQPSAGTGVCQGCSQDQNVNCTLVL